MGLGKERIRGAKSVEGGAVLGGATMAAEEVDERARLAGRVDIGIVGR